MTPEDKVKYDFPNAQSIRHSGRCPVCGRDTEYSFTLPTVANRASEGRESCGYTCIRCNWSNAGSRPVEEEQREPEK